MYQLAAPAPATIHYTTNGSYPDPGFSGVTSAASPVTLPAIGNGVTVRWWAEYPNGLRESTVHALTHATDPAASTPIGFIIERVNLNNRGPYPGKTGTLSVAFNAPARPGSYAIFAGWQNSATCNGGITTDVEIGRVIVQP